MKHGYSKLLDHACREIRHKRITRQQGLNLVRNYQNKGLNHIDLICEWLGISEKSIPVIFNYFRNPQFWKELEPGNFIFNGISEQLMENKINQDLQSFSQGLQFLKNNLIKQLIKAGLLENFSLLVLTFNQYHKSTHLLLPTPILHLYL